MIRPDLGFLAVREGLCRAVVEGSTVSGRHADPAAHASIRDSTSFTTFGMIHVGGRRTSCRPQLAQPPTLLGRRHWSEVGFSDSGERLVQTV